MDVYVVMEHGDDYHGTCPVCVFSDEDAAKAYARDCDLNQVPGCGLETCDHRYSYVVHKIPMEDVLTGEQREWQKSN